MMKVSDVMDRKLVAVSQNASVGAALKLAKVSGVDMLPVLENEKLIGIVKVEDMEHYLSKNQASDGDSVVKLSKHPIFIVAEESAQSGMEKIAKTGLSRIPVVDNESTMRCVGTVNATDLLKASTK